MLIGIYKRFERGKGKDEMEDPALQIVVTPEEIEKKEYDLQFQTYRASDAVVRKSSAILWQEFASLQKELAECQKEMNAFLAPNT